MKKTLIVLCLLLATVTHIQAQEASKETQQKALEFMTQIDMKVDMSLFKEAYKNMYVSDNPKAMIMGIVIPETYEVAKQEIAKKIPPGFELKDSGEKVINGVKIFYTKGIDASRGAKLNTAMYCMKRSDKTSFMFIGVSEIGIDKKYTEAIEVAFNSVIEKL
jgi:hypothetical protein